jgi:hypothetical protein
MNVTARSDQRMNFISQHDGYLVERTLGGDVLPDEEAEMEDELGQKTDPKNFKGEKAYSR